MPIEEQNDDHQHRQAIDETLHDSRRIYASSNFLLRSTNRSSLCTTASSFQMIKNKIPIRDEFEKLASISGSQLQQPCYGFLTYTMVSRSMRDECVFSTSSFRHWNWTMKKTQRRRKRRKRRKKIRKKFVFSSFFEPMRQRHLCVEKECP